MKSCAYCGKENEDGSGVCAECGTELSPLPQTASGQQTEIGLREILTDPVRLFRALVVVSTVTYVVWFFQLMLGGGLISDGTWDALAWQSYNALLPLPLGFEWLLLLLFAAVAVGLWMFSRSARFVFVMLTGFTIVATLLGGVQVHTAFGSFLLLLGNMADGAILIMAYSAPLKERFQ